MEHFCHFGAVERFQDETSIIGQTFVAQKAPSRRQYNADVRPVFGYGFGELEPVDRSRHVYVGEENSDLGMAFEDFHGLVGIAGLKRVITRLLHHVYGVHANEKFILDDKNDGHSAVSRSLRVTKITTA